MFQTTVSNMERVSGIIMLPTECLDLIVSYVPYADLKALSNVNKIFREISAPYLFRHVRFRFSSRSLHELNELAQSAYRNYIVYLTYEVPDLLKEGK
jgi:hypothetical protein